MGNVYVCGVGMTPFGRHKDKSSYDLGNDAVASALRDAGATAADVQAVYYAGATAGSLHGQHSIPGPIAARHAGLGGLPVFSVENACASGSTAFHLAVQAVKAGECDIAVALGAEKMNIADKARMFAAFDSGWDVETAEQNKATLLALGAGVEPPPGSTSERPYSIFMEVYAAFCRRHMRRFGTTQRQIAAVAAKNHAHSVHNPLAQFRDAMTVEQILTAPPITYPLTLPMCSPISDGAAVALVCSEAGLKRLGSAGRAVRVLASVVLTGVEHDPDNHEQGIGYRAAQRAYERAGVGPEDIDVAEVHDATAMGEILNAEALMFVPLGMAGPAAERGEFSLGGRLPINPSGGLESKGHPIGATGLGQIFELVTQLRGEAGARQVEGARIAAHENGGGLLGIEEAVVAVNLLSKD
ncbi:MAG: thiolase family protein [Hyphomonadaceae bacterium]|nr:thiolase family protein [Hyphomonadaceae bacterium]